MILFEKSYPATLTTLLENNSAQTLEVWSFDDRETRLAAEKAFAAKGIKARCRSAYKPLVCAFREEIDLKGLSSAKIIYPLHPVPTAKRFILESYPLSALFPDLTFSFEAAEQSADLPSYRCKLTYQDGREEEVNVLAPNRVHQDYTTNSVLSPCGWIIADGVEKPLLTHYEALFHDTMEAISAGPWQSEPYFPELNIAVTLPTQDEELGFGDEILSLREALHEDFYFSLIELFQRRSGKAVGARDLRPGHIVPEIRFGDEIGVKVEVRPLENTSFSDHLEPLETASRAISQVQIAAELATMKGEPLTAQSVAGREVSALYHPGQGRGLIISAGQHANEVSAPIGCLRAAQTLAKEGAEFVISPLENPDGYALHQRLIANNPRHMHHAARYTALGDDLEYRQEAPFYEKAIRLSAERVCLSLLHVNCHGYPSHEWTRPLSGYIPRTFEMWTVPKGFFVMMRYRKGWKTPALALMEEITRSLNGLPELMAFNQQQIALFNIHAGETGFEILNGVPVIISEDDRHTIPMTVITEYPDETVYGPALIAAHEAQRATVLAAHKALQTLDLSDSSLPLA